MTADRQPDWEAFYRDYRKPGYVSGYEITSKLGGGMFGLVYKATKQSIGKDYAIKFLKVDDGEVRHAVLQELEQVRHFAQVDHPNLVAIEDRGEVDGIPYLVMAYAGSQTLQELLPAEAPQRPQLLNYFLQACRGVAALHERSLVHFDLKPANIFLKGDVARVGDYGLSKLVAHSGGSLSMGRGTPYYMAPEVLQRRGDPRSDVYSLGVMLYEILVGKVPFTGDSEWEVLKQHEQKQPEFPPELPRRYLPILRRALAKSPDDRYPSVEALSQELVAPEPDAAPVTPPPLPRRRRQPTPPPRRGVARLVAFAVMVAAFSVFFFSKAKEAAAAQFEQRMAMMRARMQVRDLGSSRGRGVQRIVDSSLSGRLRRFATQVDAQLREAERGGREVRLRALQLPDLPPDLEFYKDELQPLCDAPVYFEGCGRRLELQGLPVVLAAVDLLQGFDYEDGYECHQAFLLHQFLHQATGFAGITVPRPGRAIDPMTMRRFQAAAEGWRSFVEQFCGGDAAFGEVLVATGKQERGG